MKIGFDAKRAFHNTTGLGNYSRDLIKILSTFYPKNKYILYNPKPKKVNRLEIKDNLYETLPKSKFWTLFSSIWRQGPISKQIRQDNIELFHGLAGELPYGIHKLSIKKIVTIHDLIFVRFPHLYSSIDVKLYLKKAKYAAKSADNIIAISEQTKRDIVQYLKVDEHKIKVIYQGCHAAFKTKYNNNIKAEVSKKYSLPSQFILNVGAVNKRKNLLNIIKAIQKTDTELVVVGSGRKYLKEVEAYILKHNMTDRVHFLKGVSMQELAVIYQLASIFVYPSIFEGFGIPIIEALYSKTPVITSTGSCFPEAGGPNSIYVDSSDYKNLEKEILNLLSDKEKQIEMANAGFNYVQKFNDETIAKEINNLYEQI